MALRKEKVPRRSRYSLVAAHRLSVAAMHAACAKATQHKLHNMIDHGVAVAMQHVLQVVDRAWVKEFNAQRRQHMRIAMPDHALLLALGDQVLKKLVQGCIQLRVPVFDAALVLLRSFYMRS